MMNCQQLRRLIVATLVLAPAFASANYPDRPIKLILAVGAGTSADLIARAAAEKLRVQFDQPIVVENRPGAAGSIGADAVAKAPGDGYTIGLNSSAMAINPWLNKQPFNFMRDLAPIARTGETPYVVTVDANAPYSTLDQFIDYAKKNPGKLNCATYGIGSPPHLALELFKQAAGIDIVHVPYKTSVQAVPDLASGQLACIFEPPPGTALIKAGRTRTIAHTGVGKMAMYPEAQAIGKYYPVATITGWQAIFAPSSTPKPVLERLRMEWAKALATPEVKQVIRDAGFETPGGTVEEFAKTIASDYVRFGKIIQANGIKPE